MPRSQCARLPRAARSLRGATPSSAFAIAAMCSGVLPQQPPAILISPRAQTRRDTAPCPQAPDRIPSATADSASPHSDSTTPPRPTFSASSRKNGAIRSGPSEQFNPTERLHVPHRGPERLNRLRGNHRLAAAPHRRRNHHRQPLAAPASNTSRIATSAALAFNESKIVSTSSKSAPPAISARACCVRRLHLVERHHAKSRIVGVGRIRERHRQRPHRAGHKPLPSCLVADAIRPLAPLPRRLLVDLPRQLAEKLVVDHLLVKLRILPPAALARIVDKKLALRDARRAEGIGLHDVGPGLKKPPMNVADQLRLRQREQVAVVQQVLLRVLEALPANVRLFHPVGADGRPRRSINDGDAAFEDLFERMLGVLVISS